ncbi:MAG: acyltransferase family protein [Gemmataceae bacterium]|nr:acyltransferase family protein [Gemmataceae bacterium]
MAASGDGPHPTGFETIRHALQTYRVVAMLTVVLAHAAFSLMTNSSLVALWPAQDCRAHVAFDVVFYGINGVAMPSFFFLAGIFAAQTYDKRGPTGFLTQRVRRLLVPFLWGLVLITPLICLVWAYGFMESGLLRFDDALGFTPPDDLGEELFGPAHLWFLEQLLILSLFYWAYRQSKSSGTAFPGLVDRLVTSRWRFLYLAAVTALVLLFGVESIVRLRNTYFQDPVRLLYNGVFFFVGTRWALVRDPARHLSGGSTLALGLSLPAFAAMAWLYRLHYAHAPLQGPWLMLMAACASLFTWSSIFGLIGAAIRYANRPNAVVSRLADASYWIYFAHLPVVGLLQVWLAPLAWPAVIKLGVFCIGGVGFGMGTYQLLGQYRWFQAAFGVEGSARPAPVPLGPMRYRRAG